ncbi:MAG: hypothetical protein GX573_20880 [Chloroflexi bacterium]|nr:hypothetical protein [Chloroflexota bacterium]
MIKLKLHITWPLLLLILLALLAFLIRGSGQARQPIRRGPRRPQTPPVARAERKARRGVTVIPPDEDFRDSATFTYTEALSRGVPADELSRIADREAFEAGQQAFDAAGRHFTARMPKPIWSQS